MAAAQDSGAGAGSAFAIIFGAILAAVGAAILAIVFRVPSDWVVLGALGLAAIGFMGIGTATGSRLIMDHLVAGRSIPAPLNGLAAMAHWLTGAVFFAFAGLLYDLGHDALALVLGWTGGFVLIAVLIAPYLHKSGALTVPDFLGRRYGGAMPRLLGVFIALVASGGLLVAQLQVAGTVVERAAAPVLPALGYQTGMWLSAAVVLLCAYPGGMRSVSWMQIAQGALILGGLIAPAVWMATGLAGMPVPQLALGEVLGTVGTAEAALGLTPGHAAAFAASGPGDPIADRWDFLAIALAVMIGTAASPALLPRFVTTPRVSGARASAGWALLLAAVLLTTLPAYAIFARYEILTAFADGGGALAAEALPAWLIGWPGDMLAICGAAAPDAAAVTTACGGAPVTLVDLDFAPEFLVIALPEMAGMGPVATLLLVVAGFAAALSSAGGLAMALAATLSHDLGHRMLDTEMAPAHRVTLARILLVLVLLGAGYLAAQRGAGAVEVIGFALSLAGGGLFAAIVLGIWDRRTTGPGAAAGMVTGFGIALVYQLGATLGPDTVAASGDELSWLGLPAGAAGLMGAAAALVVTWLVSRLTPAPGPAAEDFIDEMRVARDHAIAPID